MKVFILVVLAAVILASCAPLLPAPAPVSFSTLVPNTAVPTETITPPPPAPTPSSVLFRDDFGIAFASGWDWRGGDPNDVSLVAQHGALQLTVGTSFAYNEGSSSLLLRSAPAGDFEIETRVTFQPDRNYQFAGLIVYESRNSYLQAGREMCRNTAGCVGDGLYLDKYVNARLQRGSLGLEYKEGDIVFLRLQRKGDQYTFFMSPDGAIWSPIGVRQSDMNPVYVGLFAGQSRQGELPAYFDYFEIRSVEP